jgi:hypothetical protein
MLAELAPWHVFARFPTTPPHLTTIAAIMRPTAPIEVFFFIVLLTTILTLFETTVELAFPLDKLLYP